MSFTRNRRSPEDILDKDLLGCEPALEFLSLVREDLLSAESHSTGETDHDPTTIIESENSQASKSFQPPRELGRFHINGLLGSGGFAEVFLAYDPRLDREVALKVPNAKALATPEAQARFRREAQLAATLSHPNIVPVYEAGSCDELSFIAYEYCRGQSLASWFETQDRSISPRDAANIVRILAEAMQHAHHRGVLHRDLKPGNILVPSDQDKEKTPNTLVRITDFGLARLFESDSENLTAEGSQLGTPAYMSPEQAQGSTCKVTSDIYSLGVILYELLTGQLPHQRRNDLATIRAVQEDVIRPVHQHNSRVDRFLSAICMKCLQRNSEHRYRSAYELESDLAAWLAGLPIKAKRVTALQRLYMWTKQNPVLTTAVSGTAVSLLLGFVISFSLWQQANQNLKLSEKQRSRANNHIERLENTVEGVLDEYLTMLEENPNSADTHRPILDKVLSIHLELVNSEAEELSSASPTFHKYMLITKLYERIGRFDEARSVCDRAYQLTNALSQDAAKKALAREFLARISLRQGHLERLSGHQELALEISEAAIAQFEKLRVPPPGLGLDLYRLRGILYMKHSAIEEATGAFRRAEAFGMTMLEEQQYGQTAVLEVVLTQLDLANCQLMAGLDNEALQTYESLHHTLEGVADADETNETALFLLAYAKTEIGKIWKKRKQFEQAERELTSALVVLDRVLLQSPGKSQGIHRRLHVIAHLSFVLTVRGKEQEAIALLKRGLSLATAQIRHPLGLRATRDLTVRLCNLLKKQENGGAECLPILESSLTQVRQANAMFPAMDRSKLDEVRLLDYAFELRHELGERSQAEEALLRATELLDLLLQTEHRESIYRDAAVDNSKNYSNYLLATQCIEEAQQFLLSRTEAALTWPKLQYELASQLALCAQFTKKGDWRKVELQLQALNLLRVALDSGVEYPSLENDLRWQELRD